LPCGIEDWPCGGGGHVQQQRHWFWNVPTENEGMDGVGDEQAESSIDNKTAQTYRDQHQNGFVNSHGCGVHQSSCLFRWKLHLYLYLCLI
jgi:hypothetical protein